MSGKDIAGILKALQEQGFEVRRGGKGHWKVYDDDRMIASLPCTPGDARSIRNSIAVLRRAGFTWPATKGHRS